jgi:hypothetical protein
MLVTINLNNENEVPLDIGYTIRDKGTRRHFGEKDIPALFECLEKKKESELRRKKMNVSPEEIIRYDASIFGVLNNSMLAKMSTFLQATGTVSSFIYCHPNGTPDLIYPLNF